MECGQERSQETEIERGEKREFAPSLLFSLAWQFACWQNLRYPLHMGSPVERDAHTHTNKGTNNTETTLKTLRGYLRQGAFLCEKKMSEASHPN